MHFNNGSLSVVAVFFDRKAGGDQDNWFIEEFLTGAEELNATEEHPHWVAP